MANIPVKTSASAISPIKLNVTKQDTGMEQAIQNLGQAIYNTGTRFKDYQDKLDSIKNYKEQSGAEIDLKTKFNDIRLRFQQDEEKDISKYDAEIDKEINLNSEKIKDQETRLKFIYNAKVSHLNLTSDFQTEKLKSDIKKAQINFQNGMDIFSSEYKATYNQAERQTLKMQKKNEIDSAYRTGIINREAYESEKKYVEEQLELETIEADINAGKPLDVVLDSIDKGFYQIPASKKDDAIKRADSASKQIEKLKGYNTLKIQNEAEEELLPTILDINDPAEAAAMRQKIAAGVLTKKYSSKFASTADKYLTKLNINSVKTDNEKYSSYIDTMYKMVEDYKSNGDSEEFLKDMQELNTTLLSAVEKKQLNKNDLYKIKQELNTITKKPKAQAVTELEVENKYKKAKKAFQNSVPINLRSQAMIEYFNRVQGKNLNNEDNNKVIEQISEQVKGRSIEQKVEEEKSPDIKYIKGVKFKKVNGSWQKQ